MSFSSALLMMSSSLGATSGFRRKGATGARFIIPSKIAPVLSPRKGTAPVAISYKTTPKENKSVRASNSLPLTCSADIYATVPSVEPGLVKCSSSIVVSVFADAI